MFQNPCRRAGRHEHGTMRPSTVRTVKCSCELNLTEPMQETLPVRHGSEPLLLFSAQPEGTASRIPRTSDFPYHSFCKKSVIDFFCTDVQILQCVASQTIHFFQKKSKNSDFDCQNVLQQCIFQCHCSFFVLRTAKSDMSLPLYDKHSYFCNAWNLCIIIAFVHTGIAIFTLPKIALLRFFLATSRSSVSQNGCSG